MLLKFSYSHSLDFVKHVLQETACKQCRLLTDGGGGSRFEVFVKHLLKVLNISNRNGGTTHARVEYD